MKNLRVQIYVGFLLATAINAALAQPQPAPQAPAGDTVPVTADKENLARLSFQRFFRQYPIMGGMTGTAWEAAPELWQIYQRPIVRIPTNKPCIRIHLPTVMYETMNEKFDAAVKPSKKS